MKQEENDKKVDINEVAIYTSFYTHHLPTPFYFVFCIGNTLFKLPASISFLFNDQEVA